LSAPPRETDRGASTRTLIPHTRIGIFRTRHR